MDEQIPDQQAADVAKLQQLADEHLDGWKRAKADYLNLKKQADKEKEDIAGFTRASTAMEFLPIYDNLKRAMKHVPADQREVEWVKGVFHIIKQFEDTCRQLGIEPITTIGAQFDPHKHEAVSEIDQPGTPSGEIVEEISSGFMLGDRVLEHAKVIIAK